MRWRDIKEGVGRITKQNQTADVGPNEIKIQAAKFGNSVDKDGRPTNMKKSIKGSKTNVLFNLGLSENISVDNLYENVLYFRQMKENLGEIAQATEIYVDMDGVLADFFGEWAKLMKVDHYSKIDDIDINVALQKIRDTNQFWLDLPLLPQAKQLLSVIKQLKGEYNICSTPLADDPNSEPHKREWIKKNLAFFPPKNVYITHNKTEYATQSDGTPNILIDDFGKNVDAWDAAGGTGFKYKDHKFERTAKAIKQHMDEPVKESFDTQVDWEMDDDMTQGDGEAFKANIGNKDVGIQYYFEVIDAGGFPLSGVDITFEVNMTTKKTGTGDASTIFGAVVNHIKQFINQHNEIDAIEFSASKEQGFSRTRLYSAMVDKLSQGTDWINAKTISKADKSVANADVFKLIRRSAVNDKMTGIDENFADGKKKGKSRPGRVKKAGASCNGSVTSLRKKAKKASGERAKMYHWCANMKSGRS